MKKLHYLALAAVTLALFACSKQAATDQSTEEQEAVEVILENPEAVVDLVEADSVAAPADSAEVAEEPAEQPAELNIEEAPAVPSDKFAINGSEGNMIAFQREVVTADAEGCIEVAVVLDKIEEKIVRMVIQISEVDGNRIGVFPLGIAPGGTKASTKICASMGGVMSAITPGKQYKLSFTRAQLQ